MIILPKDKFKKEALEGKLGQYNKRLKPFAYMLPDMARQYPKYLDSLYKSIITERLLEKGVVNTFELANELLESHGFFDADRYNNAAGVIDDYCKTGGINTSKGSLLEK